MYSYAKPMYRYVCGQFAIALCVCVCVSSLILYFIVFIWFYYLFFLLRVVCAFAVVIPLLNSWLWWTCDAVDEHYALAWFGDWPTIQLVSKISANNAKCPSENVIRTTQSRTTTTTEKHRTQSNGLHLHFDDIPSKKRTTSFTSQLAASQAMAFDWFQWGGCHTSITMDNKPK